MIAFVGFASMTMIALALVLNLVRFLRGPDAIDRIAALDTMTVNIVAIVLVGGIVLETSVYFEIALLIALVGFVSTVAFCKYLMRGDVIE